MHHHRQRDAERGERGQPVDPLDDHRRPDFAHAGEAALDVAGPARVEVAHGQGEQPPGQEVERPPVEGHCGAAQQVALEEVRREHQDENAAHAGQKQIEEARVEIPIHEPIDDHSREDRQRHLKARGDEG